jgi:hypothetical protein
MVTHFVWGEDQECSIHFTWTRQMSSKGKTSDFQSDYRGSIPLICSTTPVSSKGRTSDFGPDYEGSIPSTGSNNIRRVDYRSLI